MGKCRDCQYGQINTWNMEDKLIEVCCCELTSACMKPDVEHDCECFNADLSEYDICYNCKYYHGGGDWGLFCSHIDMYHHLGKFSDKACERFERKADENR